MLPSASSIHGMPLQGDAASQHPRPADDAGDQEQPRKRTRCLRSCLACRKAKQRCQLPDSLVEPSNEPLPAHLACRRCVLLDNDCFVVDSAPRHSISSSRLRGNSRATQAQEGHQSGKMARQSLEKSPRTWQRGERKDDAASTSQSRETASDDRSGHYDSASTSPPPVNDLRMFDPEVADETKSPPKVPAKPPMRTMDWVKVGLTVCRPFELLGYLLRKQSISRHLFVEANRPLNMLAELIICVSDLPSRYEQEIEILQIGMPFLPSYEEVRRTSANADFLLGVVLCLSHSNRQESDCLARLTPVLRQHCLSCVLHQPRSVYDIMALILIALHLPLLLGSLSDGNSLDAAGILTSAASASQSLGLDMAFLKLTTTTTYDMNSVDVRNACLWTALSLYTSFAALAGDVERQPIIRCSPEDLDTFEAYSQASCGMPLASLQSRRYCASVSLLIYRMKATNELRQLSHNAALLMKIHREDIDRSANVASLQAICDDTNVALQSCCDALKRLQHPLASKLTSYGWHGNFCVDVLGLDLALLQLLCLSRLLEKLFERSPRLVGHDSTPKDLLALLRADLPLASLYTTVGLHRADIARHVLSLLINVVRHGSLVSKASAPDAVPPMHLLGSIPPTHLCSSLVMAGQAITEELDGRISSGDSPYKRIGDSSMEVAEILLHGSMQSLMQLSESKQASPSCARKAAHQGDLFVLTARLIDSLTRRLIVWKGLAYNSSIQNANASQSGAEVDRPSYFDLEGFSPESFEDLFREILATPIQFM